MGSLRFRFDEPSQTPPCWHPSHGLSSAWHVSASDSSHVSRADSSFCCSAMTLQPRTTPAISVSGSCHEWSSPEWSRSHRSTCLHTSNSSGVGFAEQVAGAQRGGPIRLRREFDFGIQSFPLATSRSPAAWLSLSLGSMSLEITSSIFIRRMALPFAASQSSHCCQLIHSMRSARFHRRRFIFSAISFTSCSISSSRSAVMLSRARRSNAAEHGSPPWVFGFDFMIRRRGCALSSVSRRLAVGLGPSRTIGARSFCWRCGSVPRPLSRCLRGSPIPALESPNTSLEATAGCLSRYS